jgi:hypothetical protein
MILDDYNCVFYHLGVEESLIHLFLDCPFSVSCWGTLCLIVQNSADPYVILESFKSQSEKPFFMEIIEMMLFS